MKMNLRHIASDSPQMTPHRKRRGCARGSRCGCWRCGRGRCGTGRRGTPAGPPRPRSPGTPPSRGPLGGGGEGRGGGGLQPPPRGEGGGHSIPDPRPCPPPPDTPRQQRPHHSRHPPHPTPPPIGPVTGLTHSLQGTSPTRVRVPADRAHPVGDRPPSPATRGGEGGGGPASPLPGRNHRDTDAGKTGRGRDANTWGGRLRHRGEKGEGKGQDAFEMLGGGGHGRIESARRSWRKDGTKRGEGREEAGVGTLPSPSVAPL